MRKKGFGDIQLKEKPVHEYQRQIKAPKELGLIMPNVAKYLRDRGINEIQRNSNPDEFIDTILNPYNKQDINDLNTRSSLLRDAATYESGNMLRKINEDAQISNPEDYLSNIVPSDEYDRTLRDYFRKLWELRGKKLPEISKFREEPLVDKRKEYANFNTGTREITMDTESMLNNPIANLLTIGAHEVTHAEAPYVFRKEEPRVYENKVEYSPSDLRKNYSGGHFDSNEDVYEPGLSIPLEIFQHQLKTKRGMDQNFTGDEDKYKEIEAIKPLLSRTNNMIKSY